MGQRLQDNVLPFSLLAPVRGNPVGAERYVGLKNYAALNVVVRANVGTSDAQSILTLKQAKDKTGTEEKALTFTRLAKNVDTAADGSAFVQVEGLSSSARIGVTAGDQIWQINVNDTDLDTANDYTHVRIDLSTSMADTVLSATGELFFPRYTGGVDKFPASS